VKLYLKRKNSGTCAIWDAMPAMCISPNVLLSFLLWSWVYNDGPLQRLHNHTRHSVSITAWLTGYDNRANTTLTYHKRNKIRHRERWNTEVWSVHVLYAISQHESALIEVLYNVFSKTNVAEHRIMQNTWYMTLSWLLSWLSTDTSVTCRYSGIHGIMSNT